MGQNFTRFHPFVYRSKLERIVSAGDRPMFHANPLVAHVVSADVSAYHADGERPDRLFCVPTALFFVSHRLILTHSPKIRP